MSPLIRALAIFALPIFILGSQIDYVMKDYVYSYILFFLFSSSIANFFIIEDKENHSVLIYLYFLFSVIASVLIFGLILFNYATYSLLFFFLFFHSHQMIRSYFYVTYQEQKKEFIVDCSFIIVLLLFMIFYNEKVTIILSLLCFLSVLYFSKTRICHFKSAANNIFKRISLYNLSNTLTGAIPYLATLKLSLYLSGTDLAIVLQVLSISGVALVFTRIFAIDFIELKDRLKLKTEYRKLLFKLFLLCLPLTLIPLAVLIYNGTFFGFHWKINSDAFFVSFLLIISVSLTIMTLPCSLLMNILEKEGYLLALNSAYMLFFSAGIYFLDFSSVYFLMLFLVFLSMLRFFICEYSSRYEIKKLGLV